MTTGRRVRRARAATVVALVCCGLLVSCGQERPGRSSAEAGSAVGQPKSAEDRTDGTTDESGVAQPDLTSDESGVAQPDLTSEDNGEPGLTSEEQMAGWYDARADFRAYLTSNSTKADDVLAPMAAQVMIRKVRDTNEARIFPTSDRLQDMQRVADAFAKWRHDKYDDKGHVVVAQSYKAESVEKDW